MSARVRIGVTTSAPPVEPSLFEGSEPSRITFHLRPSGAITVHVSYTPPSNTTEPETADRTASATRRRDAPKVSISTPYRVALKRLLICSLVIFVSLALRDRF